MFEWISENNLTEDIISISHAKNPRENFGREYFVFYKSVKEVKSK